MWFVGYGSNVTATGEWVEERGEGRWTVVGIGWTWSRGTVRSSSRSYDMWICEVVIIVRGTGQGTTKRMWLAVGRCAVVRTATVWETRRGLDAFSFVVVVVVEEGQQVENGPIDGGMEWLVVVFPGYDSAIGTGRHIAIRTGDHLIFYTGLGLFEEVGAFLQVRLAELAVEQLRIVLLFGDILPQWQVGVLPADSIPLGQGDDAEAQFEAVFSLLVAMAHLLHGPQCGDVVGHFAEAVDVDLIVLVADALAADECVRVVGRVPFQGAHGEHDDVAELGNGAGVESFHGGGA